MDRFDGWISGLGTPEGRRVVVGHWPRSPLGAFTDVMTESAGGDRLLLAPSDEVAAFVSATYTFDEIRVVSVTHTASGDRRQVVAGPLEVAWRVGARPPLGWVLRAVPPRPATHPGRLAALDPVVRRVLPGVRTTGSAGGVAASTTAPGTCTGSSTPSSGGTAPTSAGSRRSPRRCASASARPRPARRTCGSPPWCGVP